MRAPSTVACLLAPSVSLAIVMTLADCGDQQFAVLSDASTEAASGDAGAADANAGVDAPTPADTPFCATSKHAFCADFDGDAGLTAWFPESSQGGAAELDSKLARSAPNAVRFTLPGTGRPQVALTSGMPPMDHVVCHFDLRLTSLDPDADIRVLVLSAQDPTLKDYEVHFAVAKGRAFVEETGAFATNTAIYSFNSLPTLPLDAWIAMTVDIVLRPSNQGLVVITANTTELGRFTPVPIAGRFNKIQIGAQLGTDMKGPTDLRFDNVTCDAL